MPRYSVMLLLILIFLPSVALGERGGFYLGGQLGVSLIDSIDSVGVTGTTVLNPSAGGVGSLLVGYDYRDNYPQLAQGRVELEMSWRQNPIDTIEFYSGEMTADGDLTAQSVLMNFFYEYHGLKPLLAYYGVGVGMARVALDKVAVNGLLIADDSDDVLAYQLGLGLGAQINPKLTIDAGYRYFATEDPEFKDSMGRPITAEYQSHTILFGARYLF